MVYEAKYIRSSKIKELLLLNAGTPNEVRIRIAGEAKGNVLEALDNAVKKAVEDIIGKLPRKSKGDNKGQLSRITITLEEFGIEPTPKVAKPKSESTPEQSTPTTEEKK